MARFRLASLFGSPKPEKAKATINLERIQRYWQAAHGGDPYLELYQRARTLSDSTDNVFKQNRFHTLLQMVERVAAGPLAGDVAECGCWKGHSTFMVAERLQAARWPGRMFVFDSFEGGLSDKVAADRTGRGDTSPERTREQKETFSSRLDDVAALMKPFPFVSLHEGWIPAIFDTVPGLAERRFALVHIDVDLYEPTRDSLAFFAPRMVEGGIVVIDDYGSSAFPGCKVAVDEFMVRTKPRFFLEGHLMGAVMVL